MQREHTKFGGCASAVHLAHRCKSKSRDIEAWQSLLAGVEMLGCLALGRGIKQFPTTVLLSLLYILLPVLKF